MQLHQLPEQSSTSSEYGACDSFSFGPITAMSTSSSAAATKKTTTTLQVLCAALFVFITIRSTFFSVCTFCLVSPSTPLLIFYACIQRSATCIFQKYVRQKTSLQTLELTAAITFQMHFTYYTHTYSLFASRVTGESRARTLLSPSEKTTMKRKRSHWMVRTHTHSEKFNSINPRSE